VEEQFHDGTPKEEFSCCREYRLVQAIHARNINPKNEALSGPCSSATPGITILKFEIEAIGKLRVSEEQAQSSIQRTTLFLAYRRFWNGQNQRRPPVTHITGHESATLQHGNANPGDTIANDCE
jgi:hypothetical protein